MRISLLPTFLLAFCLFTSVAYSAPDSSSTKPLLTGKYVINLISKKGKIDTSSLQNLEVFDNYILYKTVINYKKSQCTTSAAGRNKGSSGD
jgi:hypothetical protein